MQKYVGNTIHCLRAMTLMIRSSIDNTSRAHSLRGLKQVSHTHTLASFTHLLNGDVKLALQTRCAELLHSIHMDPIWKRGLGKFTHLTCFHVASVIINSATRRTIVNSSKLKHGRAGKEKESSLPLITVSIIHHYGIKLLYCWAKHLHCLHLETCASDLEPKDLGYNSL